MWDLLIGFRIMGIWERWESLHCTTLCCQFCSCNCCRVKGHCNICCLPSCVAFHLVKWAHTVWLGVVAPTITLTHPCRFVWNTARSKCWELQIWWDSEMLQNSSFGLCATWRWFLVGPSDTSLVHSSYYLWLQLMRGRWEFLQFRCDSVASWLWPEISHHRETSNVTITREACTCRS